jgi:hypothetical protein
MSENDNTLSSNKERHLLAIVISFAQIEVT